MIGLWKRFKAWRQERRDNSDENWIFANEVRWKLIRETEHHEYHELVGKYINIVTGTTKWDEYYYLLRTSWKLVDKKTGKTINTNEDRYQ